jgi:hypothetical protein
MRHKVFVNFPNYGVGNLLLIWSRARVFTDGNIRLVGYPVGKLVAEREKKEGLLEPFP